MAQSRLAEASEAVDAAERQPYNDGPATAPSQLEMSVSHLVEEWEFERAWRRSHPQRRRNANGLIRQTI